MVGVPKTRGCENCRKRKKKCGEERPACLLCITAGWKCPGYPQRWTFVAEDSRLAAHYSKKRYIYEYEDIERKSSEEDSERDLHRQEIVQTYPIDSRPPEDQSNFVQASISNRNDTLITQLLYHMTSSKSKGLLPLAAYGSFFQFIPSHLGYNRALDESISCLCGTYSDSLQGTPEPSKSVLRQYSQALHDLQLSLSDPDVRFQAETLCASIVLHLCEVSSSIYYDPNDPYSANQTQLLINGDNGKWQLLAKGTTFLIQSRGPERYVSTFDRAMLESQQTSIVGPTLPFSSDLSQPKLIFFRFTVRTMSSKTWQMAHSAGSLDPCFLIQPEWQSLVRNSAPAPTSPHSIAISLRIELCHFLAQLTELISAFKALCLGTEGPLSGFYINQQREMTQLLHKAVSIHKSIQTWYTTELEPYVVFPSQVSEQAHLLSSDSRNATTAGHGSILAIILNCVTNSILLNIEQLIWILNQTLSGEVLPTPPAEPAHFKPEIPFPFDERRQQIFSSFEFVKNKSPIAAKPLEFGMSRLRFFDDIF